MGDQNYTPAPGKAMLTPLYDLAIALLTREHEWRSRSVRQIAPVDTDRIIDVGCGIGSLTILLKRNVSGVDITGIDPDPAYWH